MAIAGVEPGKTRIGWIGTGVMGSSMCGHLLDAGFAVTVYSRTRAKAENLLKRGAVWADTPRAVAEASDAGNGHAYFRKSPWASSDVLMTLATDLGPEERGLVREDSPIWIFPPDYLERLRAALGRVVPGYMATP